VTGEVWTFRRTLTNLRPKATVVGADQFRRRRFSVENFGDTVIAETGKSRSGVLRLCSDRQRADEQQGS
jgi:hypothetical protein